jgi:hypothetical protein
MALNIFRALEKASEIDLSSQRVLWYLVSPILFRVGGRLASIIPSQICLCSGSRMVIATVSMTHPRTSLTVFHEQSPCHNFDEIHHIFLLGQNTSSIACKRVAQIRWRFFLLRTSATKLSIKTFTYPRSCYHNGRDGSLTVDTEVAGPDGRLGLLEGV